MNLFNFSQYRVLLKVFLRNTISIFPEKKNRKANEPLGLEPATLRNGTGKKVLGFVLTTIFVAGLLALLIGFSWAMTYSAALQNSDIVYIPYFIICITQMMILFFGLGAIFNTLYFSSDNILLLSLPISNMTIFAAKISAIYVSQLLISLIVSLPTMLTFGITAAICGIHIWDGFYVYAILTPFVIPLIPLLAVTFISVPIMYLLSLIKNRDFAKNILSFVISLGFLSVYFIFIFSMNSFEFDNSGLSTGNGISDLTNAISRFGIYNKNWIDAMLGNNVAINTVLYLVYLVGALAIILFLSLWHYKKAISFSIEDSHKQKKKKISKDIQIKKYCASFTLARKDAKNFFSEPAMLMSFIMGIVVMPVVMIILPMENFKNIFETNLYGVELCLLGFSSYLATMMLSATNYFSLMGFSIEGAGLSLIKSLPVDIKDIVKSKLIVSNSYNLILCIEFFIVFSITSNINWGPLIGFINAILLFVFGFGISCFGLRNDMRKPTLHWENIQRLTRNNTRIIKPMLLAMGLGLFYMIAGIISGLTLSAHPVVAYIIYFMVFALTSILFAAINFMRLWKEKDDLFDAIEC